jgi:hypothetical protein
MSNLIVFPQKYLLWTFALAYLSGVTGMKTKSFIPLTPECSWPHPRPSHSRPRRPRRPSGPDPLNKKKGLKLGLAFTKRLHVFWSKNVWPKQCKKQLAVVSIKIMAVLNKHFADQMTLSSKRQGHSCVNKAFC